MKRNLDGAYFRVKRDGKWQNICLSDMTEEELDATFLEKDPQFVYSCLKHLVRTIQKIGDEFDIVAE